MFKKVTNRQSNYVTVNSIEEQLAACFSILRALTVLEEATLKGCAGDCDSGCCTWEKRPTPRHRISSQQIEKCEKI